MTEGIIDESLKTESYDWDWKIFSWQQKLNLVNVILECQHLCCMKTYVMSSDVNYHT